MRPKAPVFAPWLLVSPLLALSACAGWPRFSGSEELPPLFEKYPVVAGLSEDTDFAPVCGPDCPPDPPREGDLLELSHLFEAGLVSGTIDPSAYDNTTAFSSLQACPGAEAAFGINGAYAGDLDYVQVNVSSGGLCMVLAPGEDGTVEDTGATNIPPVVRPGLWDVVIYPYNAADNCVTGPFLSRGKEGLAASTHMPGTNFATLPVSGLPASGGEYLVLIGIPERTPISWGYELYLLPTRDDPRSCMDVAHQELTSEDFEEIQ